MDHLLSKEKRKFCSVLSGDTQEIIENRIAAEKKERSGKEERSFRKKSCKKLREQTLGKAKKSVWRMPGHCKAKKDAANGETRRRAVSTRK